MNREEEKRGEMKRKERAEQMRADCVLAPGGATEEDGDARDEMRSNTRRVCRAGLGPARAMDRRHSLMFERVTGVRDYK